MSRYVSQREFAKHVGRSHVWVNRLVKDGRLPSDDRGRIPLTAGLAAFDAAQPPDAEPRPPVPTPPPPAKSAKGKTEKTEAPDVPAPGEGAGTVRVNDAFNRARLAEKTFQAKLRELEYKEASGELIPAADVRADAANTGAEVRDRLMSVPPRVAAVCEGKTAREIERIVDEAINEALSALQRGRFSGEGQK